MCRKLKDIHNLKAKDILSMYCPEGVEAKVDMTCILNQMGISFSPMDFTPLEEQLFIKGNDTILGIACSNKDDLHILYSSKLNSIEMNYVLAHELAHCCLHLPVSAEFHVEMKTKQDIYSPSPISFLSTIKHKKKELEADNFAAELLIPTSKLLEMFCNEVPTIENISEVFGVPNALVRKKLYFLSKK